MTNTEGKKIPKTRFHLQKLTRKINRLENTRPFVYLPRGTGVMALGYELEGKRKIKRKVSELKLEKQLVERGLLEIVEIGENAIFKLTQEGVVCALKDRIITEQNEMHDNEKVFAVFDVPEETRKTRDVFRVFLKKAGFLRFQNSVWFSKKRVYEDLSQLIKEMGIEEWARVIVGVLC